MHADLGIVKYEFRIVRISQQGHVRGRVYLRTVLNGHPMPAARIAEGRPRRRKVGSHARDRQRQRIAVTNCPGVLSDDPPGLEVDGARTLEYRGLGGGQRAGPEGKVYSGVVQLKTGNRQIRRERDVRRL